MGKPGKNETRQIAYVMDNSDKLFLSRQACEQLGIISKSFPTIGEIHHTCNLKEPLDDLPQPMGPENADTGSTDQQLWLSQTQNAPTSTHQTTLRTHSSQQTETAPVSGDILQGQYVQHMQTPAPAYDVWLTY